MIFSNKRHSKFSCNLLVCPKVIMLSEQWLGGDLVIRSAMVKPLMFPK